MGKNTSTNFDAINLGHHVRARRTAKVQNLSALKPVRVPWLWAITYGSQLMGYLGSSNVVLKIKTKLDL